MPTITPVELESAQEASARLLNAAETQMRRPVNMLRTLAHSPAMLDAYMHFSDALNRTQLSAQLRNLLTNAIAQEMGSEYMLAISVAFGIREGLSPTQIEASRRAESFDSKIEAALQFAVIAIKDQGHLPSSELESLREAGYSDQEIVEIIGMIAINVWRNLFSLLAQTTVDFPLVKLDEPLPQPTHA